MKITSVSSFSFEKHDALQDEAKKTGLGQTYLI